MRRKPNHKMNNNNGGGGGGNNNRRRYRSGGDNNTGKIKNVSANRDKFLNMARDAMASGDRVEAENYLQHAEHYFRVLSTLQEEDARNRPAERSENEQNGQNAQSEQSSDKAPKKDAPAKSGDEDDSRGNKKAADGSANDALKLAS